jgi:hypothetical protein
MTPCYIISLKILSVTPYPVNFLIQVFHTPLVEIGYISCSHSYLFFFVALGAIKDTR